MKCKYEGNGVWEGRCVGTREVDPCKGYEKCENYCPDYQTNADRIRNMSDEELAEFLAYNNKDINDGHFFSWQCNVDDVLSWLYQPAEGEQYAESCVVHATTVDAVPVVHGHWEKADGLGYYRCSNCRTVDDKYYQPDYCPNCGADMREVAHDQS